MVIIVKLAAKLQIQLAAELSDPLTDMGGLALKVFLVIKSSVGHSRSPLSEKITSSLYLTLWKIARRYAVNFLVWNRPCRNRKYPALFLVFLSGT